MSQSQSENPYRVLVDLCPDAIFVNTNDRITIANDSMARLVRAGSPAELIGLSPFQLIHPDAHQLVRDRIRTLKLNGGTVPGVEYQILRLDRTAVLIQSFAARVNFDGSDAILVYLKDLTEQRRVTAELMLHRNRLETLVAERSSELESSRQLLHTAEQLASLGILAASIAHEINNPLGSISLAAEQISSLARRTPDPESILELTADILEQTQLAARTIKNIVEYSRSHRGEAWHCNPSEIATQAVSSISSSKEFAGVHVRLVPHASVPRILANGFEIEQALASLLRGILGMPGDAKQIEIRVEREGESVLFRISDGRKGLLDLSQVRIGKPFSVTAPSSLGLSMSVAQILLTRNGGHLRVEATARGTEAIVELPIKDETAPREPARSPQ